MKTEDSGVLTVTVSIRIVEGKEEQALEALSALASTTNEEPGCMHYEVLRAQASASHVLLLKRWRDEEALEAHMAAPHYQAARQSAEDQGMLETEPVISRWTSPHGPS